jgi:flagellar basal body-associated protein FliL
MEDPVTLTPEIEHHDPAIRDALRELAFDLW